MLMKRFWKVDEQISNVEEDEFESWGRSSNLPIVATTMP